LNQKFDSGMYEPTKLMPKRVTTTSIKTIRIRLLDDKGLPFEFKDRRYPVVCQLVFKRIDALLYKSVNSTTHDALNGDEQTWHEYW
jgi:hypothetical protein